MPMRLAGREDIPVAASADAALDCYRIYLGLPDEAVYWRQSIPPAPTPVDRALTPLRSSIEQCAIIATVGAYTNLALFEKRSPGILRNANLVLMGGRGLRSTGLTLNAPTTPRAVLSGMQRTAAADSVSAPRPVD